MNNPDELGLSSSPKRKECRYRGKEGQGKRAECYTEGKINVTCRYNRKYILVSAFFMNNSG